jgi:MFS family permease
MEETRGVTSALRRIAQLSAADLLLLMSYLLVTGLFRSGQNAAQTTAPLIAHDQLNLGPGVIGLVIAAGGAASLGTNLLLASVKRVHPKVLFLGLATAPLAAGLLVLAHSTPIFILAIVLLGIAGGIAMPGLASAAGHLGSISTTRGVVAFTVALSASLAIGPLLEAGVLHLSSGSLRAGVLTFVPLMAVAAVIGARKLTPPAQLPHRKGPAPSRKSGWILFHNPLFRAAATSLSLYQFPFIALVTFGAILARTHYGATAAVAQLGFTAFFVTSFLSRVLLLIHPPRSTELRLLRIASFATLIGVVGLGIGHGELWYFATMAVLGVPHGLTYPLSLALVSQAAAPSEFTQANSLLSATTGVITLVGPLITGYLSSRFGIAQMFVFMAVPTILFSVPLYLTPKWPHATDVDPEDGSEPPPPGLNLP